MDERTRLVEQKCIEWAMRSGRPLTALPPEVLAEISASTSKPPATSLGTEVGSSWNPSMREPD